MAFFVFRTAVAVAVAFVLACTSGMSCAHTAAKREVTLRNAIDGQTLQCRINTVTTTAPQWTRPSETGYLFFVFPFQRDELYSYGTEPDLDLAKPFGNYLNINVSHQPDSAKVTLEAFVWNRRVTEADRASASELLWQMESALREGEDEAHEPERDPLDAE